LQGRNRGLSWDPELLYIGTMFHDLGLNEEFRKSGRRFEVDSADEARRVLQGHGVADDGIRWVWTAIALHTTPGIPEFMEPEVSLVTAGGGYDAYGFGYHLRAACPRGKRGRLVPRGVPPTDRLGSARRSPGESRSLGNYHMSHHLDTPLARQNGRLYIDDLYVFPGERGTVFVMDVNSTITGPDIQYGFHPEARYEFKVIFGGADFEALTYRVSFGERDSAGRQALQLHAITGGDARDDTAAGWLVLEGRTGEPVSQGAMRIWAGRITDPFYIDLSLLGIVNSSVQKGAVADWSAWRGENAQNSFAGTTVESIVLEVSHEHPQLHQGAHIGVWCATKLATDSGGWQQINRAGHPMMWPIFWPTDTDFSDPANQRHPSADFNAIGKHIGDLITAAVEANGTSDDPESYGQTVAQALLPDVLRYVVGTPASYGFAARNGRTLADNAPEAMLSLALNTAVPSGLKPSVSADLRRPRFPYVVAARSSQAKRAGPPAN